MRQGTFGKGTGEVFPKLYGLRFCIFHFYAFWLCIFVLLGVPTVWCVSHDHVDLDPRGADINNNVMWSCAGDGGMLGCEHCQWVVWIPWDADIELKFDVPCRKGVGVRNNSAVVTCL